MSHPGKQFKGGPENLPALDWAQLASFIDGEGSIYIHRGDSRRGRLMVSVSNTSLLLMQWLGRFDVGKVSDNPRCRLTRKPSYQWRVISRQAAWILRGCLPYFVIKHDEARVGLAYQSLKKQGRHRGMNHKPDELVRAEQDLARELHRLKEPRPLETFIQ